MVGSVHAGRFRAHSRPTRCRCTPRALLAGAARARASRSRRADRQAVELLRSWNVDASGTSAARRFSSAWFHQLAPAHGRRRASGRSRSTASKSRFTLHHAVRARVALTRTAGSCDDRHERPRRGVRRGGDRCAARGRRRSDANGWAATCALALGRACTMPMFPHQGLDTVKFLRPLLSRSVPNGGDWSTVNVATGRGRRAVRAAHTFPATARSSTCRRPTTAVSSTPSAESGHFLSSHYADFLPDWHDASIARCAGERRHRPRRGGISD